MPAILTSSTCSMLPPGAQSTGSKPLPATDYFNRLASRIGAALGTPTAAGPLYDIDTRLRPQGAQGMLAVSLESFEAYQRQEAWTWEHMALCRARPLTGSDEARARVRDLICEILRSPADQAKIRADSAKMREEIARHKPPAGPLDIKLGPGGLVDLEFTVHTLQLTNRIGLDPRLEVAIGGAGRSGTDRRGCRPGPSIAQPSSGSATAGRDAGNGAGRKVAGTGRGAMRLSGLAGPACRDRRCAAENLRPLGQCQGE